MSKFNANLKEIREQKGITAKEMAIDLGIPYTTYIKYEWNGEPRYDTLIRIADYLNVSIDDLLGYSINEYEKAKSTLEQYEISVTELDNGMIQATFPLHKLPRLTKEIQRSAFFPDKKQLSDFVNECLEEVVKDNFLDCVVDHILKGNVELYLKIISDAGFDFANIPNGKDFLNNVSHLSDEGYAVPSKLLSLGLDFPKPPPSEGDRLEKPTSEVKKIPSMPNDTKG